MRTWQTTRRVRFADCDPAGIVFFPQYLVMLNTLHEQWFDEALDVPYATLIGARRTGMPTVRLEVDFTAISRHGDDLVLSLGVTRLGRSSLELAAEFFGRRSPPGAHDVDAGPAEDDRELRLRARQVLVCTSLDTHRPQPFPSDLRAALERYAPPAAPAPSETRP
jgi:4-hydroxybenzoyl-CoA thioesterase